MNFLHIFRKALNYTGIKNTGFGAKMPCFQQNFSAHSQTTDYYMANTDNKTMLCIGACCITHYCFWEFGDKMARKRKGSMLSTAIIIAAAAIMAFGFWAKDNNFIFFNKDRSDNSKNSLLTAEFFDVGQGDSSLFILPDGKTMLVDAANNSDGRTIVSALNKKGIKKIDYLVATHPHADHIGGMAYVINNVEIGKIFAPKIPSRQVPTSKTYENFLTAVKEKGLKITAASSGPLFSGDDYIADCLSPVSNEYDDLNNYSVVIHLTYGAHSFLLMGDAEAEVEQQLLNNHSNIKSNVIKLGHHGSSTSTTPDFLKNVSPEYAVISCGAGNTYGHPHKKTLNTLNAQKTLISYFRTDTDHAVTFVSDGRSNSKISVSTNQEN